jgi:hypothetical protein
MGIASTVIIDGNATKTGNEVSLSNHFEDQAGDRQIVI